MKWSISTLKTWALRKHIPTHTLTGFGSEAKQAWRPWTKSRARVSLMRCGGFVSCFPIQSRCHSTTRFLNSRVRQQQSDQLRSDVFASLPHECSNAQLHQPTSQRLECLENGTVIVCFQLLVSAHIDNAENGCDSQDPMKATMAMLMWDLGFLRLVDVDLKCVGWGRIWDVSYDGMIEIACRYFLREGWILQSGRTK